MQEVHPKRRPTPSCVPPLHLPRLGSLPGTLVAQSPKSPKPPVSARNSARSRIPPRITGCSPSPRPPLGSARTSSEGADAAIAVPEVVATGTPLATPLSSRSPLPTLLSAVHPRPPPTPRPTTADQADFRKTPRYRLRSKRAAEMLQADAQLAKNKAIDVTEEDPPEEVPSWTRPPSQSCSAVRCCSSSTEAPTGSAASSTRPSSVSWSAVGSCSSPTEASAETVFCSTRPSSVSCSAVGSCSSQTEASAGKVFCPTRPSSVSCSAVGSCSSPTEASAGTVAFVSVAEDANSRFRSHMEDGHHVLDPLPVGGSDERWGFFAVYDGHGGRQAVDHCEAKMHDVLVSELESSSRLCRTASSGFYEAVACEALTAAFRRVDSQLATLSGDACCNSTGCTATVALVRTSRGSEGTTCYVANVGDSRALLVGKSGTRRLSVDHRASDPAEASRVKQEGGMVFRGRVAGSLTVTRALGDHDMKPYVSCVPHVSTYHVEDGARVLVIASDGLWDCVTDKEVQEIIEHCLASVENHCSGKAVNVRDQLRTCAAHVLVNKAKQNGSTDNILVLAVFF
eukprot:TRINITY_DN15553_c0_g1_i1.p1 TRINITY_DN15553_c0_g1~~TRINITY_DN15553_c0_g1_i1.p1  ORF type:complete len:578 (+),score=88.39 TRINITY_DN15553_c0_g1_i1:32-1735(+)